MPRVSVEVGYFRRWLGNFTATDNTSLSSADFTPFALNAPSDARLPNGGGYAVNGLYNITAGGLRPAGDEQHHRCRQLRDGVLRRSTAC